MYKLIRLLLVLTALACLAGFAYIFYNFYKNKDVETAPLDIRALEKSFPKNTQPVNEGHLIAYQEYEVIHELEVTGKLPPPPKDPTESKPAVKLPKVTKDDMEVVLISFSSKRPKDTFAYIKHRAPNATPAAVKPNGPPKIEGDVYRRGEHFELPHKPGVDLSVADIRRDAVDIEVDGQDEMVTLVVAEYSVETKGTIQDESGGAAKATNGRGRPEVQAPAETTEVDRNSFDVGRDDYERISQMSEERIFTAVRVRPERNPATNEPYGLRVQEIEKGSVFERQGLKDGDIIVSVNDFPATDRGDLMRWLRTQEEATSFNVVVERFGALQTLSYRMPANSNR